METQNYLIGRQPILNREEEIVAYELLFRSAASRSSAQVDNASFATASVIINTLSGFGLDHILGTHKGFINMELDLLMGDSLEILPKDRVVLELLETLVVTPELIARCKELKDAGFVLALDDHQYDPIYEQLYPLIDVIKVDLFATPIATLGDAMARYQTYPVKLLAEKVETREEYLQCLDLGFELFQGYYFAKPSVIEKKKVDESQTTLLKLMRLLMEDAETEEIERTFKGSPGLTYKLLMLVNSVSLGLRQQVTTVRHALSILGNRQMKRWVQLALFASDGTRGLESPLLDMAAVRASFMEQLAAKHGGLKGRPDSAEQAFMTGILSLLESLYNISMAEVADSLNLADEVKEALVSRSGVLGDLLTLAELLEKTDFSTASKMFDQMGISMEDVLQAQLNAYNWHGGMR